MSSSFPYQPRHDPFLQIRLSSLFSLINKKVLSRSSSRSLMAASATSLSSSFSTLSLRTPRISLLTISRLSNFSQKPKLSHPSLRLTSTSTSTTTTKATSPDVETIFFEDPTAQEDVVFEPPSAPEGFVAPPSFDDGPLETEDEIAASYEELYGPAYSGVSVLGNDINVMNAKIKKATGFGSKMKKEKVRDGFEERVVQVRRVTKVVKGGKQLHFRAIVVVGDKQGQVGVGVGKAKEVIAAVQKSATNARRNIIRVPMTKYLTFPHR